MARRWPERSSTEAPSTSPPTPRSSPTTTPRTRAITGCVFARDLGVGSALGANLAFILKARVQLLRDLGPAVSPFNAFLIGQGIETLSLRLDRHLANTRSVAEFLDGHDQVEFVRWASLPSSDNYELAQTVLPEGLGCGAGIRDLGRGRGRQEVRRGADPAQPRG
ncbi:MAG: PLP-dependent transferase [Dermatophilaceae bacterium]